MNVFVHHTFYKIFVLLLNFFCRFFVKYRLCKFKHSNFCVKIQIFLLITVYPFFWCKYLRLIFNIVFCLYDLSIISVSITVCPCYSICCLCCVLSPRLACSCVLKVLVWKLCLCIFPLQISIILQPGRFLKWKRIIHSYALVRNKVRRRIHQNS